MSISLLQKPKRTLSNFSIQQFQKAKQFCRDSLKQYRQKFSFQPDWDSLHKNKRKKSNYQSKKINQAAKVIKGRHTYSVQSKRNLQIQNAKTLQFKISDQNQKCLIKKMRPSTAHFTKNFQNKRKQFKQNQQISSALFQNQTLLNSFQSCKLMQKQQKIKQSSQKQRSKNKSTSLFVVKAIKQLNQTHIIKIGASEPYSNEIIHNASFSNNPKISKIADNNAIKSVLSVKQNFYNPYNIRPNNPYSIPIKHLRNGSIDQLKQLCQQQRNINFNKKFNDILLLKKQVKIYKKRKQPSTNIPRYFNKNNEQYQYKQNKFITNIDINTATINEQPKFAAQNNDSLQTDQLKAQNTKSQIFPINQYKNINNKLMAKNNKYLF